jgi:hypothetical protein
MSVRGQNLTTRQLRAFSDCLIVILIERATTVIDPVAATAAHALLRSYLCFRRFSLTLNFTILATRPTGIGFSMGNCTAPLEVL